ncbi:MAG: HEAT repeat domain-containing protein [Planctomycetaceae bacterium]
MSENADPVSSRTEPPEPLDSAALPDNLPPVSPPSAGFIVQLFVVPALIVMAVIGVWLLFGQLAAGDQDLSRVLADLRSDNIHRQWRAAFSLAQILEADAQRGDQGKHLSTSTSLATDLATMLQTQLKVTTPRLDDLQKQSYLTRSLGWFDLPEIVFPALSDVLQRQTTTAPETPEWELQAEMKQSAMTSMAQIAGRAREQGNPLEHEAAVLSLGAIAGDTDPRMRRMAAFTLSLFTGGQATEQLEAMLVDADEKTRLNAAVGLTRNGSLAGYNVLVKYLKTSATTIVPQASETASADDGQSDEQAENRERIAEFERGVAIKNVVKALGSISEKLTSEQRSELVNLIEPISLQHEIAEVRQSALESLNQLRLTNGRN